MRKAAASLLAVLLLLGCSQPASSSSVPEVTPVPVAEDEYAAGNVILKIKETDMDGYRWLDDNDPAFAQVSMTESFRILVRVFSSKSVHRIRWPKYWSFSFSISPSNEYSGLISFRMDWLDLLAVQGTLKSLFQYHSSKASILQHSALFIVQLSHLYMTTGKTIALTRWTFAGKVISLLFNMLSRLVIAFLPRSKCLLISWRPPPSWGRQVQSLHQ